MVLCLASLRLAAVAAVACFQGARAFAVPAGGASRYISGPSTTKKSGLHRDSILSQRTSWVSERIARRLSIHEASAGNEHAEEQKHDTDTRSDHDLHDLHEVTRNGLLTRLDFGLALGGIGASVLLGTARQAFAEDVDAPGEAAEAAPEAAVAVDTAAPPAPAPRPAVDLRSLGLEVPYTGKALPLNKFLGSKATLVVNPKLDDPESLHQVCVCVDMGVGVCLVCVKMVGKDGGDQIDTSAAGTPEQSQQPLPEFCIDWQPYRYVLGASTIL